MSTNIINETNQPLVSVAVITYNSSATIVELLESIKSQTYPKLELVISDDASTDSTIAICDEWIKQNGKRFTNTEIVRVAKNTGISGNYNRAEAASHGDWIKIIAGDDLLLPQCIQSYINYVTQHTDAVYVFSRIIPFMGNGEQRKILDSPIRYDFFEWTIEEQYRYLIYERDEVPAPAVFFNKLGAERIGVKCDERIPMIDDWPRWVNLLKAGVRLHFIDEELVMYRISEQSMSSSSGKSDIFNKSMALFYIYYQYDEFKKDNKASAIAAYVSSKCIVTKSYWWKMARILIDWALVLKSKMLAHK